MQGPGSAKGTLERAIAIAVEAHTGQFDKAGAPYVLHPVRMMFAMTHADDKIVAVLHDVVEDAEGWTFHRLEAEGFSADVLGGLRSVTKLHPDEDYDDFIARAMANPIGCRVKLADLRDNCNLTRIKELGPNDFKRLAKYHRALGRIEAAMT
jgi:(p)ppGpp synthase/HD superfamily hydrolase